MKALAEAAELLEQSKLVFKCRPSRWSGRPRRTRRSSRVTYAASSSCCPERVSGACRPRCPRVTTARGRALPEARRRRRSARRPARHLPPRAVLPRRCGYCDFNTYTADQLGTEPGSSRAGYVDAAIAELDLAARVLGPPRAAGVDGLLRRRHADPAAAGGPGPAAGRGRGAVRADPPTRRSPPSPIPSRSTAADLAELRALGLHPDLVRHAVGGAARARRAGPGALAGSPGPGGGRGPGGRLRPTSAST